MATETYEQVIERERQTKLADYYGKTITAAQLRDLNGDQDDLLLTFATGEQLRIYDSGQNCCESRYMRTDDDVQSLVGHILLRVTVKDGPNLDGEEYYGDHEQQFVEVSTTGGLITLVNHNEHNGYYGGFSLCIERIEQ